MERSSFVSRNTCGKTLFRNFYVDLFFFSLGEWSSHKKFCASEAGAVTNLVVIPHPSLLPSTNHQRGPYQIRVSLLDKCPQPESNSSKGAVVLLRACSPLKDSQTSSEFRINSLDHQIFEMEVLLSLLTL